MIAEAQPINTKYDFNMDDIVYDDKAIYIDYKYETIKDIMSSIKNYYVKKLETKTDLEEDEIMFVINIYKENIYELYLRIVQIYNQTEEMKKSIDSKIKKLINKPLEYIVYESSWCNEELLLSQMLRIDDILNMDITLENIINDIYEYEVSLINNKLFTIFIESDNDLLYLVVKQDTEYITKKDIIFKIIDDYKYNIPKIEKLKEIVSAKIYQYIVMYKHVDENKILCLYNCLDIKHVKIIIDKNDYNMVWIMRKLYMLTDKFIPTFYVDKKLEQIINLNIEDNIITIKYNKDASTNQQITKYLIDQLYNNLIHYEINKI